VESAVRLCGSARQDFEVTMDKLTEQEEDYARQVYNHIDKENIAREELKKWIAEEVAEAANLPPIGFE
jgi:hypothetical protein